jgi:protein TonB
MFSGLAAIEHHPARRWTAMASFMVQSALLMGAFVYPLLHPSGLPEALMRRRIFVPASNGEVRVETSRNPSNSGTQLLRPPLIVMSGNSSRVLGNSQATTGVLAPPGIDVIGPPDGDPNSLLRTFVGPGSGLVPHPPAPTRLIRTSSVMEGLLIHRVQPQYPAIARQLHIQGAVIVDAIIGRDGHIQQAHVTRGQTLLNNSALEAVKQWQYRPYHLNGEPIEVETQITVNFVMER